MKSDPAYFASFLIMLMVFTVPCCYITKWAAIKKNNRHWRFWHNDFHHGPGPDGLDSLGVRVLKRKRSKGRK